MWDTSDSDGVDSGSIGKEDNYSIKVLLIFLATWQYAFKISNNAMTNLLCFLKFFVKSIGIAFGNDKIKTNSDSVPSNFNALHKCLHSFENDFISYVVCPTCSSVYEYNDCVVTRANGIKESKDCSHISYPNHPHLSRRKPCGTTLLKKVQTKSGYILKAFKTYPYMPLSKSLSRLLNKDNFIMKCQKWRSRIVPEDYLCDVYDGRVWKFYNSTEGNNFLASSHNYLLTLNTDWFQPYERGVYSVGVIYLTVQNLPREDRYKLENILLVDIIPGPSEPKLTINSFLAPLVLELKEAWEKGFSLTIHDKSMVTVKLALTCVACDIPASRKVCGFISHNAALGCNKCLKKFDVQFGEQTDYSGFDIENWTPRFVEQHCHHVTEILKENTKSKIEAAESKYGLRYSVLLDLPYFNPVQSTIIDVMHNMFLGIANIYSKYGLIKIYYQGMK